MRVKTVCVAFGLVLLVTVAASAGNGGKPPVELGNNLSLPAVAETETGVTPRWLPPADPYDPTLDASVFGVHYSYGCDKPETYDIFAYPNTSCVDDLMAEEPVYYDASECMGVGGKCEGYEVYRIYWQKVDANDWWAESDRFALGEVFRTAAYVDWGDALESVSWNIRSVIRVETQPYGSLMVDQVTGLFDTMLDTDGNLETCEVAAARLNLEDPCRVGFHMWHVSGQGPDEQWGVRATDPIDGTVPEPYIYQSPFQIIHTYDAMLNFSKLEDAAAACPEGGGGAPGDPAPSGFVWNGDGWDGTCEYYDIPYTVELSVGGKYVYGYNLRMKNVELDGPDSPCPGWEKPGWWRLTYYTINGEVFFDPANPVLETTAPPAMPNAPTLPPFEEDTGPLYTPVVDYDNNLTYLDICIEDKVRGRE